MPIRILVFDDNLGRQEALKLLIETAGDMVFAGGRENCVNVENDVAETRPDVVLMDINMPGVDGIEGLKRIRAAAPRVYIIMQTVFEDEEKIFAAIRAGANGYFLKKTAPARLIEGIREVLEGGAPMTPLVAGRVLNMFRAQAPRETSQISFDLTPREQDILHMLTQGLSYKMIADACNISYHTVNSHLKKIYEKLHVHSATEAIAKMAARK